MRRPVCPTVVTVLGLLFFSAGLVGCGPARAPTGKVSGKVTLQGQPLSSGVVLFSNEKLGAGASAKLDPTGSYQLDAPLPVGSYQVAVQPPPPPAPHEMPQAAPPPRTNIPAKYQDPKTSELKATVNEGSNTADFAI
jgi:hypothetical protein